MVILKGGIRMEGTNSRVRTEVKTGVKVDRDEWVVRVKGHMKDTIHRLKGCSLSEKVKGVYSLLGDVTKLFVLKTEPRDKNITRTMDLETGTLRPIGKILTGMISMFLVLIICRVAYVPIDMGISRYQVSHYVNENGYTIEEVLNDECFQGNDADYSYSSNLSGDMVTLTAVHPDGKRYGELRAVFTKTTYKGNDYWRCQILKGNVEGRVILDYGAMLNVNLFLGKDGTL